MNVKYQIDQSLTIEMARIQGGLDESHHKWCTDNKIRQSRLGLLKGNLFYYLKQFGASSLSFSTLQKGLEVFFEPGCGYLAYCPAGGLSNIPICLSDPICSSIDKQSLLNIFLDIYPNSVFVHVDKDTVSILHDKGFYINEIGVETIIDIDEFDLSGNKKQFLRSQRNRALKDKLTVLEGDASIISPDIMRNISDYWIRQKTVHTNELAFIARPAIYKNEPDVRKFFAMKDGKPVGFVFFDPMYKDGQVYGYIANIVRSSHECSYSVCDFIILEAMEIFRKEGIKELSLGFSPFADISDDGSFRYSKPTQLLFKYLFKYANYLYAFQLLAFHKTRYRPGEKGCRQVKSYCASKTIFPIHVLYACFVRMGIDPATQTLQAALKSMKNLYASASSKLLPVGNFIHF